MGFWKIFVELVEDAGNKASKAAAKSKDRDHEDHISGASCYLSKDKIEQARQDHEKKKGR